MSVRSALVLAFLAAGCGNGSTSSNTTAIPSTVPEATGGFNAGGAAATNPKTGGAPGKTTPTNPNGNTGGTTSTKTSAGKGGNGPSTTQSTGGGGTTTKVTDTSPSCTNGKKDGTETDVDCGGSCSPCVSYVVGQPKSEDTLKSACDGGDGYICPRFMLFSPEMIQAAKDDANDSGWPSDSFNYGVATLDGEACCSCFQIAYDEPRDLKIAVTPPRPLIVQMFNTGADGNVDVFMGKGGMGAFSGGCPRLYSTFPMIGENWAGGIRASNMTECGKGESLSALSSAACVEAIEKECSQIQAASAMVTSTTRTSCVEANKAESLYHENWNIRVRKIACPTHLTEVTGCKPADSASLPKADPTVKTAAQATGSGWQDKKSTSMQDCCKPSCSWSGKTTNMLPGWDSLYTCTKEGTPITK